MGIKFKWQFSLNTLEITFQCVLVSIIAVEKLSLKVYVFFFWMFLRFYLSLSLVFCTLNIMHLTFLAILSGDYSDSWIFWFVSFTNFGIFSAIISSDIISIISSFFCYQVNIGYTFSLYFLCFLPSLLPFPFFGLSVLHCGWFSWPTHISAYQFSLQLCLNPSTEVLFVI